MSTGTPQRQPWTLTARTVVFALMAAAVLLSIVAGKPLPFAQRLQPQQAALLRRGGDNLMNGYYLALARGMSQERGDILLLAASDFYQKALKADPSDIRNSVSAAIVMRELGNTTTTRELLRPLNPGEVDERTRRALAAVYALTLSGYPSPQAIEAARDYLSSTGPGALVIAYAWRVNGRPDRAEEALRNAAQQARPVATRLIAACVVNGLIVFAGIVMIAWRIVRRRPRGADVQGEFVVSGSWGSREAIEALVLWVFLIVSLGSALLSRSSVAGALPAYLIAAPSLVATAAAIAWVWAAARLRPSFGWDAAGALRKLGIGLGAAGLAVLPGVALYRVVQGLIHEGPADNPVLPLLMVPDTALTKLALLVTIGLVVPIVEETFWRGILFSGLRRRWSYWPAALVSAFVFAVAHQHLAGFLTYALLGLLFAYLYEASRSLVTSWAAHAAFNVFNLMLLFIIFG